MANIFITADSLTPEEEKAVLRLLWSIARKRRKDGGEKINFTAELNGKKHTPRSQN